MSIFLDLSVQIKAKIEQDGPISIYDFMKHALHTAESGYYTGQPFIIGKKGDFITAPEISQLFGELIGLWCLNIWKLNGSPTTFNLVELGPGRGTLMKDLLRATKNAPDFHNAMNICLVEINKDLILKQQKQIKHKSIQWFMNYEEVPHGFSIIIANEFFDALPINQYTKRQGDWYINMVDLNSDKNHLYINQFDTNYEMKDFLSSKYPYIEDDGIVEIQDEAALVMGKIATNVTNYGGAALVIDYGYTESKYRTFISTLQAIKNHKYSPIFEEIGNADISSHINFTALYDIAKLYKTYAYGPVNQNDFLAKMYIDVRKNILLLKANEKQKAQILSGYDRLMSPNQMGSLFKVLAITDKEFTASEIGF